MHTKARNRCQKQYDVQVYGLVVLLGLEDYLENGRWANFLKLSTILGAEIVVPSQFEQVRCECQ